MYIFLSILYFFDFLAGGLFALASCKSSLERPIHVYKVVIRGNKSVIRYLYVYTYIHMYIYNEDKIYMASCERSLDRPIYLCLIGWVYVFYVGHVDRVVYMKPFSTVIL
jgi:hypothetical protein